MNLAIALTLFRLLIGPIFLLFYRYYAGWNVPFVVLPYILLLLLIVAELTDLLDGYFARKKGLVTDLGKVLDPMADSIFRISVFLTFTGGVVNVPLILVFVFLYRDMIIATLRTVCSLRGVALAARWSGKIKAVIQAVVSFFILILMIPYSLGALSLGWLQGLSITAISIAALYTVISGIEYLVAHWSEIKNALTVKSQ